MHVQSLWRLALLGAAALTIAGSAHAQATANDFERLSRLVKDGDRVSVTGSSGGIVEGNILDVRPSALTLKVDGQPREFLLDDVRTISRQQHANIQKGAWWGFGIGVGLGLAGLPATECRLGAECAQVALTMPLMVGGISAAIGAGFAAATTRDRVIFVRSGIGNVKLSAGPIVDRTHTGVRLTARW
jgi:hypothetical protein